jgi:hippurate hydrolase
MQIPCFTAWRQDLHAHPELGFEEHRTSEFVAAKLAEFGCEVHRNIGKTVRSACFGPAMAPSIGLRADMDALPIHEANAVPYRSNHEGSIHACGHDGHTTMLLGAARYLAETRDFAGTVHFILRDYRARRNANTSAFCDHQLNEFSEALKRVRRRRLFQAPWQ